MIPTHRKRAYHAQAVQWVGVNVNEVREMFRREVEFHLRPQMLMIRFEPGEVRTLSISDWIVKGENGTVKCYTDEQFKIKYEIL